MRVLLIEPPPNPNWMLYPHVPWVGTWMPHTGLIRIATAIHYGGHEVRVAEVFAQRLDDRGLRRVIEQFQPDVVGTTAITATLLSAMSLVKLARRVRPGVATVMGGVHPTLSPEEVLVTCPELDYVVVGEGERTVVELLARLSEGWTKAQMEQVQGLAFQRDGSFVRTPGRPLIESLDELPMPKHDLFSVGSRRYRFPNIGPLFLRSPAWSVEVARGCEYDCRFCVKPVMWRGTLRYRSAAAVADEVEVLTRKHGITGGQLFANDLFVRRGELEDLVIEMERRKLHYHGVTFGRADTVVANRDLLPRLVKLGLVMLWIGVESMEQAVLDHIVKGTTPDMNVQALRAAEAARVPVIGPFYMVGLPEHTAESLAALRRSALKAIPRFSPGLPAFVPTPGTPLYYEAARKGLIETFDYAVWDVGGAVCRTETMSVKQVDTASRKLGMTAMFRPSFFFGQLFSGSLHGFLQAFIGPAIVSNMLVKKVWRLKMAIVRKVRAWLGRPDELLPLFEEARAVTRSYAAWRAEKIRRGEIETNR